MRSATVAACPALAVQAIGTAVRVRGVPGGVPGPRPAQPFLADVPGEEVTALLRAGWVPVGLAAGFASCIRHDDVWTQISGGLWAGNTEVPGFSELVGETRHRARAEFARQSAHLGGSAAVVRTMSLRSWEQDCTGGRGGRDHLAEASVIGTALTAFPLARPRKTSLMVLPVGGARERALADARRVAHR